MKWILMTILIVAVAGLLFAAIGGGPYQVIAEYKDAKVEIRAQPRIPILAAVGELFGTRNVSARLFVFGPYANSSQLFPGLAATINHTCAPARLSDVHAYSYQNQTVQGNYAVVVLCTRDDTREPAIRLSYKCKINPSPVEVQTVEQSTDRAIKLLTYAGQNNGLYWLELDDGRESIVPGAAQC
jgi:hypothetical protein